MNKAAKCDFPGISDDQAEGSRILSPSHLAKWIPLPAVISVSYNKYLIHNVAQPKNAKPFTGFSAKPCKGDSKPAPGALDELLQLLQRARMSGRDQLQVLAPSHVGFVCVRLNLISYLCAREYKRGRGFVVFTNTDRLRERIWQRLPPKPR